MEPAQCLPAHRRPGLVEASLDPSPENKHLCMLTCSPSTPHTEVAPTSHLSPLQSLGGDVHTSRCLRTFGGPESGRAWGSESALSLRPCTDCVRAPCLARVTFEKSLHSSIQPSAMPKTGATATQADSHSHRLSDRDRCRGRTCCLWLPQQHRVLSSRLPPQPPLPLPLPPPPFFSPSSSGGPFSLFLQWL